MNEESVFFTYGFYYSILKVNLKYYFNSLCESQLLFHQLYI